MLYTTVWFDMRQEVRRSYAEPGTECRERAMLNRMGTDGWELVAVCDNRYYFKKPTTEIETISPGTEIIGKPGETLQGYSPS